MIELSSLPMAAEQEFDYLFKVVIVGNSGVGKTAFLLRFAEDRFQSSYVPTVGVDFKLKTLVK